MNRSKQELMMTFLVFIKALNVTVSNTFLTAYVLYRVKKPSLNEMFKVRSNTEEFLASLVHCTLSETKIVTKRK